jgi:hypothetical protein
MFTTFFRAPTATLVAADRYGPAAHSNRPGALARRRSRCGDIPAVSIEDIDCIGAGDGGEGPLGDYRSSPTGAQEHPALASSYRLLKAFRIPCSRNTPGSRPFGRAARRGRQLRSSYHPTGRCRATQYIPRAMSLMNRPRCSNLRDRTPKWLAATLGGKQFAQRLA